MSTTGGGASMPASATPATPVYSRSTSSSFARLCCRMKPIAAASSRMLMVSRMAPAIGTP